MVGGLGGSSAPVAVFTLYVAAAATLILSAILAKYWR